MTKWGNIDLVFHATFLYVFIIYDYFEKNIMYILRDDLYHVTFSSLPRDVFSFFLQECVSNKRVTWWRKSVLVRGNWFVEMWWLASYRLQRDVARFCEEVRPLAQVIFSALPEVVVAGWENEGYVLFREAPSRSVLVSKFHSVKQFTFVRLEKGLNLSSWFKRWTTLPWWVCSAALFIELWNCQ